jgi:hypothetical protein
MSLHELAQRQAEQRAAHRRRAEAARREALEAASRAARAAGQRVRAEAGAALRAQGELERQSRALAFETERFAQQTARWLHAHRELSAAMEQLLGADEMANQIEQSLQRCTENLELLCESEQARDRD